MTTGAGVLRSEESLAAAGDVADEVLAAVSGTGTGAATDGTAARSLGNIATVARALVLAARERRESRGAHARTDHTDLDPSERERLVVSAAAA